jgi:hypothetical protein
VLDFFDFAGDFIIVIITTIIGRFAARPAGIACRLFPRY